MLPEWTEQDAVLLAWPHEASPWAPWFGAIEATYRNLATAIAPFEPLLVLCRDGDHAPATRAQLSLAGISPSRYRIAEVPFDDTWVRDYGPLARSDDGELQLLDFRFNGWGGRHTAERDDAVNAGLAATGWFAAPFHRDDHILEGGAVETDGAGTLLLTRRSQFAPGRNDDLDEPTAEAWLTETLGVERVLWLEHGGLKGDDTDGHVDTLVRFADPGTLIHQDCDDPDDPHYEALSALAGELAELRTAEGEPYELHALPWPRPQYDDQGNRLPATYANFLLVNGGVIAPTYHDAADSEALAVLQRCFPEREVVGVDARTLLLQAGSVHCATLQLPRGSLNMD
ncbi:agmatine deiminase family protein [Thiohalospira sp.]|uniref:agmatine deiminase family protein n=1 Tax=Thiohalospira sp. TaxID=3080549 RepID=UPI0039800174